MLDSKTDSQTDMLSRVPESAMCVQRFNDSRNSAIHITYRISLRSSSLQEPRDPLPKVVVLFKNKTTAYNMFNSRWLAKHQTQQVRQRFTELKTEAVARSALLFVNDPTAGSPTVTLLRLLLPLNDQV